MQRANQHNWLDHIFDFDEDTHQSMDLSMLEQHTETGLHEFPSVRHRLARKLADTRPYGENKPFKRLAAVEGLVEAVLVDLFKSRDVVYPSDVVAALDLDYDLVEKIFVKFVRKGKLKD